MPDLLVRGGGRLVPWLVAAVSVGVGLAVVRPFVEAPVGFDTQATVLYFDRIASGARLEQFLSTTPKPMLTLVHGVLHGLTGDWRPIVWATMLAQAAAAALAFVVAAPAAGPVAGTAAALVVAGMPLLVEDSAFGNAVPWALLGWLAAAWLLLGSRPRPVLAGVALLLAALCRLETLVIVATLGVALAWARVGPWLLPGPRPDVPARAWLAVAIPFAALPVMLLHDWLLTGDPMYWLTVSERYSDARRDSLAILGPIERIGWFVRRYRELWAVIPFALAGLVVLVRGRRWGELVGLAGMGPGIAAFIVLLATRGLYAPERYALPVDVALLVLAGIGFGWAVARAIERITPSAGLRFALLAGTSVAALAGLWAIRAGPFDPELARVVGDVRTLNENAARVGPLLRSAGPDRPDAATVRWVVPSAVRPRLAVDLGVPATVLAGLSLAGLDPAASVLSPGQVVYHDLRGDLPRGGYGILETGREVPIGNMNLRPTFVDAERGAWLFDVTGPS